MVLTIAESQDKPDFWVHDIFYTCGEAKQSALQNFVEPYAVWDYPLCAAHLLHAEDFLLMKK